MTLTDRPETGGAEPDRSVGEMTLSEHLGELRTRLIIAVVAVLVTGTVMFFLYNHLISFMEHPYCNYVAHHPSKSIGSKCQLYITAPLDGFTTRLKVSAYAGTVLASPVLLWELWRFITPGLHKKEKRYVLPFFFAAVGLFSAGVVTAIIVFPKAITWLINISGQGVVPLFQPTRYFTLYAAMALIFGGVFLYPLVVVFLEISGVVPSAKWRAWRRPAIIVMVVVAAVITPSSDPFTFFAMALPLLVFYEASILIGRLLHK